MKKKILIPLTAGILVSGCVNTDTRKTEKSISDTLSSTQEQTKTTTKIYYTTNILDHEQQQSIQKTISAYLNFFNTSLPEITISEDDTMTDKNTLAYADPWIIYIVPKNITTLDKENLDNVIIHELFHSIKPKEAIAIEPYRLKDGSPMIGFHGLSILVQNGKKQTQFGLIEDAAAVALTSKFKPEFVIQNPYYANIGSLMLKMIGKWRLTTDNLIQSQKTNDVYFMIGEIIHTNTPTNKNVEDIIWIFNKVYSTDQDITNEALTEIEVMRKK